MNAESLTPDRLCERARAFQPSLRRRMLRLARMLEIAGVANGDDLHRVLETDHLIRDEVGAVTRLMQ